MTTLEQVEKLRAMANNAGETNAVDVFFRARGVIRDPKSHPIDVLVLIRPPMYDRYNKSEPELKETLGEK